MIPPSKFNIILRNISRHIQLTDAEAEFFRSLLTLRKFRRRQFLLHAGDVCRHEMYVLRGCLRGFYDGPDGSEHTTVLAAEDWWISDLESLLRKTPATMSIEALEETEVIQLEQSAHDLLYQRNQKFDRFFRILLQNAFIAHQRRILSIISLPAEQRYRDFVERYPQFARRVPQKHIASYLGITPEFLSRIRRKLSVKNSRR